MRKITVSYTHLDIDEYIVEKYHQTIPEMFEVSETYFRNNETAGCKDVSDLNGHIISTGGGVVLRPENIKYLKQNGIIIYIDRPIDNILTDVQVTSRPLLKEGPQKLYELDLSLIHISISIFSIIRLLLTRL